MNGLAISAHVLAAVVWVGGMFFAYVVLRPTLAMQSIDPEIRLSVWAGVFKRFFPWVWLVILVLLTSGYWLIFRAFGGFASTPLHVHLMHLLAVIMIGLFVYLYYRLLPHFKLKVNASEWPAAAGYLNRIRHVILINLILGIITVIVASAGRYL